MLYNQNQRETTLAGFRGGRFSVLVATDVAARGLDISGVELVLQIEPPKDPETYIHRSGGCSGAPCPSAWPYQANARSSCDRPVSLRNLPLQSVVQTADPHPVHVGPF